MTLTANPDHGSKTARQTASLPRRIRLDPF
jgi:hypothetical protein